jgi:hypothetical protein
MDFLIKKTINSPLIKFANGKLLIAGRSIPEDSIALYEPLFNYLKEYSKNPAVYTEVNIMLEYSNSSTNRSLMTLFENLNEFLFKNEKSTTVNWYYVEGDNEMLELGSDFKDLVEIPFIIIKIDSFPEF